MPTPMSSGGPPVTMGPQGFWLDAQGSVSATDPQGHPQVTPGMRDNPSAAIYYDDQKDLFYNLINGKKQYQSPSGRPAGAEGSGHGMTNPSGGLIHTGGTWNPDTGTFDQGIDWGNLLSLGIGGVLTGGTLSAAMGGGAAAGGAGAAVAAPEVGGGTLASTLIGTGAMPGIAGGTGLGAAATGAGVGAGTATAATAATGGGLWGALSKYILPTAIPAVTSLIGAEIAANQADKGLQAQTDASNKALGLSQSLYNARQQQIAPYVGTGRAALGTLSSLMGLPANAQSYQPPQVALPGIPQSSLGGTASLPPAVPPPTTSTQPPQGGAGMVTMRAPTGEVQPVPQTQVQKALSLGAMVVSQ